MHRLKGTGGSALGGASSALVGTSGSLSLGAATAAAHVALTGTGSSRVTSSGVELRELRRHNYKASVSVLSHLNKGNSASPYVSIAGGHRQRTRAHRAMNMGQKISSEYTPVPPDCKGLLRPEMSRGEPFFVRPVYGWISLRTFRKIVLNIITY